MRLVRTSWIGRSAAVALAALHLAAAVPSRAGADSFLAPNPQVPDAVPYRREYDARPAHDDAAESGDEGDTSGAAEATAQPGGDDGDAVDTRDGQ